VTPAIKRATYLVALSMERPGVWGKTEIRRVALVC
jgi:hypothetical protein